MNEIILLIIAIILFFFGYEIRPWIVTKYPENRHFVDLMVMTVTITTVLIPLISLIESGTVVIGSYFIVLPLFVVYLIYYGWKHKHELKGKPRKILSVFIVMYVYIFIATGILMAMTSPLIPNIRL